MFWDPNPSTSAHRCVSCFCASENVEVTAAPDVLQTAASAASRLRPEIETADDVAVTSEVGRQGHRGLVAQTFCDRPHCCPRSKSRDPGCRDGKLKTGAAPRPEPSHAEEAEAEAGKCPSLGIFGPAAHRGTGDFSSCWRCAGRAVAQQRSPAVLRESSACVQSGTGKSSSGVGGLDPM